MWIPKWVRDRKKGVDSAMPTQVVSNEEFIPRPQTKEQKQVEYLIGTMAEEKSKKLGMERRAFMATSMGMATCFLANNMVFGTHSAWAVDEIETMEPGAYEDKYPKSEYFVMDVQSHFTNGIAIGFRNMEFVKNMGFKLTERQRSLLVSEFRQGNVLRQRDGDARDLGRARPRDSVRRRRQAAGRPAAPAAACCPVG